MQYSKLSIMQPTYLPWMGYFNLIHESDIFVFYDDVQLTKRSWQVRNRIKTANGELYLTIPIKKTAGRDNLLIEDAEIHYKTDWVDNHLKSIKYAYSKSDHFNLIYGMIRDHLTSKPKYLSDLTCGIICDILDLLHIHTKITWSSMIPYRGNKDRALISICRFFGAETYLSTPGSADYILEGENLFEKNDINLEWHNYDHPTYPQLHGDFLSHMGIIDALFNVGPEETERLVKGN